jgi:fructokinase
MAELPKTDAFYADSIDDCIAFAGKVSGLVCSKIGAMSALPSLAEVEAMHFEVQD